MVVLKKIKAATLVESLVSSAIILMVFMFASLTLNSAFKSTILKNTGALESRLNEIEYLFEHQKIQLPFYEETEQWDIEIVDEPMRILYTHKLSAKEGTIIIQ